MKNDIKQDFKQVPVEEQETHIYYMRDEDFARIYTCDRTQITRLDKLCKSSPDYYSVIYQDSYGKTYKLKDKELISLRKKKTERSISEQQKEAAAKRFKEYREKKKNGDVIE